MNYHNYNKKLDSPLLFTTFLAIKVVLDNILKDFLLRKNLSKISRSKENKNILDCVVKENITINSTIK